MLTSTNSLAVARHVLRLAFWSDSSLLAGAVTPLVPLSSSHSSSSSSRASSSTHASTSATRLPRPTQASSSQRRCYRSLSPSPNGSSPNGSVRPRSQLRSSVQSRSSSNAAVANDNDSTPSYHTLRGLDHNGNMTSSRSINKFTPHPRRSPNSSSSSATSVHEQTSTLHPQPAPISHRMLELFRLTPRFAISLIQSDPSILYHPSTYPRIRSRTSSDPASIPVPTATRHDGNPEPFHVARLVHNRLKRLSTLSSLLFHLTRVPLPRLTAQERSTVLALWSEWIGIVEHLHELDAVPYFRRNGRAWVEGAVRSLIAARSQTTSEAVGVENRDEVPSVARVLRALEWMKLEPTDAHTMVALQRFSPGEIAADNYAENENPTRTELKVPGLSDLEPDMKLAHFEPRLSRAISSRLLSHLSPLSSAISIPRITSLRGLDPSLGPRGMRRAEVEREYLDLSIGHVVLSELDKFERRLGRGAWKESIDSRAVKEWMERRDELVPLWLKLAGQAVDRVERLKFDTRGVKNPTTRMGGGGNRSKGDLSQLAVPTKMEVMALWLLARDRTLHTDLRSPLTVDWRMAEFNLANPFSILRLALGFTVEPTKPSPATSAPLTATADHVVASPRPNGVDRFIVSIVVRLIASFHNTGSLDTLVMLLRSLSAPSTSISDASNEDKPDFGPSTSSLSPRRLFALPAPRLPLRTHKRLILTATSGAVLRRLIEPLSAMASPALEPSKPKISDTPVAVDDNGVPLKAYAFHSKNEEKLMRAADGVGLASELIDLLHKWGMKTRRQAVDVKSNEEVMEDEVVSGKEESM